MKQFVLSSFEDGSGTVSIAGEDYHYLTRVLRKRPGDGFRGIRPDGTVVSLLFISDSGESCLLSVDGVGRDKSTHRCEISLFQCLPKGQKMDLIVRQATETGVARIVPVVSSRSVPRVGPEQAEKKRERWNRIARQAMQQSGCPVAPDILPPVRFDESLSYWKGVRSPTAVSVFFHQETNDTSGLHALLEKMPEKVGIFIGPEGGFSDGEVTTLLQSGFQPV